MKIVTNALIVFMFATAMLAQQPAKTGSDQQPKKDSDTTENKAIENFYKLAIAMYEVENGKRTNQRDYVMIGRTNGGPPARISVNTRVPVATEEKKLQYIDAGLSLSCNLKEQAGGKLQAQCDASISNFIRPEQLPESRNTGVSAPVLRTTNTNTWALLTLGKPVVIASIDDVNSAKRLQIEVTAAKLD